MNGVSIGFDDMFQFCGKIDIVRGNFVDSNNFGHTARLGYIFPRSHLTYLFPFAFVQLHVEVLHVT